MRRRGQRLGAEEGGGGRLSIATGGTSGVYFVYGGGLAKVISRTSTGYRATAETTSASVDNLILIKEGSSDIAFTLGDTALDAIKGREGFKEQVPMRALAQIYDNYTQVVAKAGSGIKSIEDLKGKRVSVGAPNSGTEVIADRMLEAAGIDPKSGIKRQGLGVEESVQAMKDGSIDAFFWSGGLPTGAVTDLTTSDKITLLDTTGSPRRSSRSTATSTGTRRSRRAPTRASTRTCRRSRSRTTSWSTRAWTSNSRST